MAKGRALKNPNGYGSVVKLSGKRRKPFEVRVNTKIDDRGYPVYDVLDRFTDRTSAMIALAEYNKDPYDVGKRSLSFSEVYDIYYDRKYIKPAKKLSDSSRRCTVAAYNKCESLYHLQFSDIRPLHMQAILDNQEYSHAMLEHIKNLFRQMYSLALEYDIVQKNWSDFITINKEDDDEHGISFSEKDLSKLWENVKKPYVDVILIYMYSGWRVSELLEMPLENIDLKNHTFKGGNKTKASKDRVIPIHSAIFPFVEKYYKQGNKFLFSENGKPVSDATFRKDIFYVGLQEAGIDTYYTPHDCRHTFATLLNNAGANPVSVKRLMGHSTSGDITIDIYTHKGLEQLREAIELIKAPK